MPEAEASLRDDVLRCIRCGFCNVQCPTLEHLGWEGAGPRGRIMMVRAALDGRIPPDETLQVRLAQCTTCGQCQSGCVTGLEIPDVIERARRELVRRGRGLLPGHHRLARSVRNYGNPWMQPRARRADWADGLGIGRLDREGAPVLFYPGCTYAYDPVLRERTRAFAVLLQRGGVEFGILGPGEETCGGTPLRLGDWELFRSCAEKNVQAFNGLGIETLITPCAGCYKTLVRDYPRVGRLGFEVKHVTEVLAQLVGDGRLQPAREARATVTYHDPCHLGRHMGVYDAPRLLLESIPGLKLVEMEKCRGDARCCGAGGGVKTEFPELAGWMAGRRLEQARRTGASILATACPFCEQNLAQAAKGMGGAVAVADVAELLLRSL